jgi:hypothetical protein
MIFQVVRPDNEVETFRIGPHTPSMKTEDVVLVHKLWLQSIRPGSGLTPQNLHHSDIVTTALTRLARDLTRDPEDVYKALRRSRDDARFGPQPQRDTLTGTGAFQSPLLPPRSDLPPTEPRSNPPRPTPGDPKE